MKKVLLLWLLASSAAAYAQNGQMSEAMSAYKDACLKLLEGIDNDCDKYTLYDAIDLFKKVRTESLSEYDYKAADSITLANELRPVIQFVPEYADTLILRGRIVELDEISAIRKIGCDTDLLLLHKGIRPQCKVSYLAAGAGHCEMLVVAESGAGVELTVVDSSTREEHHGRHEDLGNVVWTEWSLPEDESQFVFTVENTSDREVSFVIAVNAD